jgi:hypothetical protein
MAGTSVASAQRAAALLVLLFTAAAGATARARYPLRTLIDEPRLRAVEASVRAEQFRDEKVAALEHAARIHWFTVAQAERLIPLFEWREDRLRALAQVAPWLVDGDNAPRLLALFPDSSDRERARRLLSDER